MGVAARWQVIMVNDDVSASNPAQFGIEVSSALTVLFEDQAAQIIAYATYAASQVCAAGTRILALKFVGPGENFSIDVPFPVAEYGALQSANDGDFPGLVPQSDYGVDIGDGGSGLQALGTSVVMTEYANVGGPAGRGRHFIPFINGSCVDAGGFLGSGPRQQLELAYTGMIFGSATTPALTGFEPLLPMIENAAGTTETPISRIKCQPVFSNLKSRRR